jgi:hypothetical protein
MVTEAKAPKPSLKFENYTRKPFTVQAVQVTEDNLNTVAEWCGGEVQTLSNNVKFIKVDVSRPITTRQTRAFLGDWVLYAGRGFKVYTEKAFRMNFAPEENVVQTSSG